MDSVIEQPNDPKDVYFLGAGVSALAGVPTFTNFRKKAEDICNKKIWNNESNNQFERVLKYWDKYFNECNVEEFYSAVEMREMLVSDLLKKEKQETVTTDEIENFIYSTIQNSINKSYLVDEIYQLFLRNITMNSVIITTNWDILLETSSGPFSIRDNSVRYEAVQPYTKKDELGDFSANHFHILKLHGSLNWGFCDKCGNIYYFDEKIHNRLASKEGVACNNNDCDGKLARIIVPPKLSKLIKPEQTNTDINIEQNPLMSPYFQLRSIWSEANKYLKMCEKVYFIGYSFPETDVQMKIFISNALRGNSNLKKVTIVSRQKHGKSRVEFEERYLSIFSRFINQSKIKFYYGGFEEFCNEFAHSRNPYLPINSDF
ncbi:MAG: SIR2 family protein [Spirochaetes bacterium]|nr:SIR2 family protein [Spirochaetota bacterium]